MTQVDNAHRQRRWSDDLPRFSIHRRICRSQDFVSANDLLERLCQ
jgi:hypothetical protein